MCGILNYICMKVYVFGNQDIPDDSQSFEYMEKLNADFPAIEFIFIKPNEDLPFVNEKYVVIIDAVEGLSTAKLFENADLDKIKLSPRASVHDFDLGFQLKYLKKMGKLGDVTILGIPMTGDIDYSSIHSMVKKLVAQDMQGS